MRNATIYTLSKTVVPVYDNKYVDYAPPLGRDEVFRIVTDDPENKVLLTKKTFVESLPLHEVGFFSSLPLRDLPEVERESLVRYNEDRKFRNYDPYYLHLFAIEPQTERILSTFFSHKRQKKISELEEANQNQKTEIWKLERKLKESQDQTRYWENTLKQAEQRIERYRREPLLKRIWIALRLRRDGFYE